MNLARVEDWLAQAISLYRICLVSCGPAEVWHEEFGELQFTSGLTIAEANEFLALLRDGVLQLVWVAVEKGDLPPKDVRTVVTSVLDAFDRSLSAQASAYVRESQRHLNEANRSLEFRQRLFERDLALAKLVQQQFIPSTFESRNFRADVRYIPTLGVGGDHAGIFKLSEDCIYVTICDVTGHGVASALVAEVVSSYLRPMLQRDTNTVFEYRVEPVDIIRQLNCLFFNEFQHLGILLTFFVALFDLKRGILCYSGAGHPPPLLFRPSDESFVELASQNVILGAVEDCVIGPGEDVIPIQQGDRVAFYTDGIIEATNHLGDMFGIERLRDVIRELRSKSQTELANAIIHKVSTDFSSSENDDMSLMLVDVLGKPGTNTVEELKSDS